MSPEQVSAIRSLTYDETVVSRAVEEFNISPKVAREVLKGQTYGEVEPKGRPIPRQRSRRKLSGDEVDDIRLALTSPYWGQQSELAYRYRVSRHVIQRIQYGTY